jgi:hypothetical protein
MINPSTYVTSQDIGVFDPSAMSIPGGGSPPPAHTWQPYDLSTGFKLSIEDRHERKTHTDPPKWAQPEMSANGACSQTRGVASFT